MVHRAAFLRAQASNAVQRTVFLAASSAFWYSRPFFSAGNAGDLSAGNASDLQLASWLLAKGGTPFVSLLTSNKTPAQSHL